MGHQLPGFYIVRLVPRRTGDGNLRGTFVGQVTNIRNYNIAGDYRKDYEETVWSRVMPSEITLDFGQPPRESVKSADGLSVSNLKPAVGDVLILVHGSRSPSGDGVNARRGLIGLAQVEDVYFYKNKNLDAPLTPTGVSHNTWATARCSLRAKTLAIVNQFLITPEQLRSSSYYVKSGLHNYESALGIGSTSASGNVTDFLSDTTTEAERKQRVVYLLGLFIQFDSAIGEALIGTDLEKLVPKEVIPISKQEAIELVIDKSARNRLFFGSPGSGKSREVRKITQGHRIFTTTFHPDYDYNSFVGAYKPIEDEKHPGTITYRFEPNVLINAYVEAWKNPSKRVYIVVEEINRGNCAQIFGDLFLLLDRDYQQFSDYILSIDRSISRHLKQAFTGSDYEKRIKALYQTKQGVECADAFEIMAFPSNLFIYATMNTSDQSLFPMDSAFKRRWDWEYIPIDYEDADQFTIVLSDDYTYRWGRFIECVNRFIVELTGSEDKQLGNRFVNPPDRIITLSMFKSKVLFYLWSEIYKNETDKDRSIFQYQPADAPDTVLFTFSQLYEKDQNDDNSNVDLLASFMRQLGMDPLPLSR